MTGYWLKGDAAKQLEELTGETFLFVNLRRDFSRLEEAQAEIYEWYEANRYLYEN